MRPSLLLFAFMATLLLTACREEQVAVYRVPKEKDPELPGAAASDSNPAQPTAAPGPSMADSAVPTASGEALSWRAPAAWVAKAASAMRKASYSIPGVGGEADLSITAFPGDVGGELANVNRWRGQIALAPINAEDLDRSVSRIEQNGLKVTLVELASKGDPNNKAILGAIVPFGGSTWFFKISGPGSTVRASKPAFLEFLRTVRAP